MYRHELKYLINQHQKDLMSIKLRNLCYRDPYSDADGGYLISSLYFDDHCNSAYFDKLAGIKDRKKFRIRVYNHQSDVIKLERKVKRDNVIHKTDLRISKEEYDDLLKGEVGFLLQKDHAVAKDFFIHYRTRNLRPGVVVEYRREAFIYDFGDVRVTFDRFLRAGVFRKDLFSDGYLISAFPDEQIILEVKYTGYFPDVIRRIIQLNSPQRQACSKYAKCFVAGR